MEFIRDAQLSDPTAWVDAETASRIREARRQAPDGKLQTVFAALDGTVSYDVIRITLACMQHEPPEGLTSAR